LNSVWKSVRARSGNVASASSCTDHVPPAFGSNRAASSPVSRTSPARIGAPRATPLSEIRAAAMNGCPPAYPAYRNESPRWFPRSSPPVHHPASPSLAPSATVLPVPLEGAS